MNDPLQGLHPEFSSRLGSLLKAAGGRLKVTDGFRTYDQQSDLYRRKPTLAARPGHSLHEQGLAADLSGDLELAHQLAPQFGLEFPMLDPNGSKVEPWHVQMAGAKGTTNMSPLLSSRFINTPSSQASNPSRAALPDPGPLLRSLLAQMPVNLGPDPDQPTADIPVGAFGVPNGPLNYQPSLRERANQAQLTAAGSQVSPVADKEASLQGSLAKIKRLRELINALGGPPEKTFTPFQPEQMPQREQVPIPDQARPRPDGLGFLGAAIASLVDPQAAGRYSSAPLNASVQDAADTDKVNYRNFLLKKQSADQAFEDKIMGRNERNQVNLGNLRGGEATDYANKESKYSSGVENAKLGAEETRTEKTLGDLGTLSRQWSQSNKDTVLANQAASDYQQAAALRAAKQAAANKQWEDRLKLVAPLLNYYGKGAELQRQTAKDDATQTYQSGMLGVAGRNADSNASRVEIERQKANAENGVGGLTKGSQTEILKGARASYDNAQKERGQVERQLYTEWAKMDPSDDKTDRAKAKNNFKAYYTNHPLWQNAWQREIDTKQAWENAKKPPPPAPGHALDFPALNIPGLSNLRLGQ